MEEDWPGQRAIEKRKGNMALMKTAEQVKNKWGPSGSSEP
jgi:hypothetical protein